MPTNARIQLNITGSYEEIVAGGTLKEAINERFDFSLLEGVGELQFNRFYKKSGTATTTPATAIDLSGTDTDDFGRTTDATEVVAILFKHLTPGGGTLIVGAAASANLIDFITAQPVRPAISTTKPGMRLFLALDANGMPVTPTTADKVTVAASAGSIAWEALIFARA